jgi:hypothetical protein
MASHSAKTQRWRDVTDIPSSFTNIPMAQHNKVREKEKTSSDPAPENVPDDDDMGHAGRNVRTPHGTFNLKNVNPVLTHVYVCQPRIIVRKTPMSRMTRSQTIPKKVTTTLPFFSTHMFFNTTMHMCCNVSVTLNTQFF